ncbi:MAG: bacteriohemerythrin [Candidatus Paceibacterota bacterium]
MEKIIWTEEYSVGIQEIDEQHKHFFGIVNSVLDLTGETPTKEEIFEVLEKLGDYAFYHFSTEERFFDKFHYPSAVGHIAAHNQYRETIKKYFDEIRSEGADVPELARKIALSSGNWLIGHILEVDRKYTIYFHEQGLK